MIGTNVTIFVNTISILLSLGCITLKVILCYKIFSSVVPSECLIVTILIIHHYPLGMYIPFSDYLFFHSLMSSHLKVALNTDWQSNWDLTGFISINIFIPED